MLRKFFSLHGLAEKPNKLFQARLEEKTFAFAGT